MTVSCLCQGQHIFGSTTRTLSWYKAKIGSELLGRFKPAKVSDLGKDSHWGNRFDSNEAGETFDILTIGVSLRDLLNLLIKACDLVGQIIEGAKIFLKYIFVFTIQSRRLISEPLDMFLRPVSRFGLLRIWIWILQSPAKAECKDLLLHLLQSQLMIIAHANVFFDLVILLGRDMNCVVVSVGKTLGDHFRIKTICFVLSSICSFSHGCRSHDNALYVMSSKLIVQWISKAASFISGNEIHFFAILFVHAGDVLKNIFVIRTKGALEFTFVILICVAANRESVFMNIHSDIDCAILHNNGLRFCMMVRRNSLLRHRVYG